MPGIDSVSYRLSGISDGFGSCLNSFFYLVDLRRSEAFTFADHARVSSRD
jgi:hypothetical protein